MDLKDVSIATITWARDEREESLLRKALEELNRFDIPIFITDGGSNSLFIEYISSLANITITSTEKKGLYNQVTNSLSAAFESGSKFIFYTEPDKFKFFKLHLREMLNSVLVNEATGIITASRSEQAFKTFPSFQHSCETTINNCCTEITQQNIDFTYGPFILNRSLVPYLEGLKETIDWGWRPYIFCIAYRLGYTIEDFVGAFECPPDQREDDAKERIYRMKQLSQNIEGIVLAATKPLERESQII